MIFFLHMYLHTGQVEEQFTGEAVENICASYLG